MMNQSFPEIGTRLNLHGSFGTIRYIGEVRGSHGSWLGVEWDDPQRGKHNGSKDGVQYFTCRYLTSGSFIRSSASILFGRPFLDALISKYVELPRLDDGTLEKVLLGSSNGVIEVEIVGLNKVRDKLAQIERLREVSLDDERVASAGDVKEIKARCLNVRGLDLSKSLIPSWDVILQICSQLPLLQTLSLSHNRLAFLNQGLSSYGPLSNLTELRLNNTLMQWTAMLQLSPLLPNLIQLELGYNEIEHLHLSEAKFPRLEHLNLDTNRLNDWLSVLATLQRYVSIRKIMLTTNAFKEIPPLGTGEPNETLTHLYLASNQISNWSHVDAIGQWFPNLQVLTLFDNPLMNDPKTGPYARQLAIGRLPSLKAFNVGTISRDERKDCELFYLSFISRTTASEEVRIKENPLWLKLCEEYGRPDEVKVQVSHTMGSKLIGIELHRLATQPIQGSIGVQDPSPAQLQILPNMPLKSFKLKALKTSSRSSIQQKKVARLYMWMQREESGSWEEMDAAGSGKDVGWWGVESGSKVGIWIED